MSRSVGHCTWPKTQGATSSALTEALTCRVLHYSTSELITVTINLSGDVTDWFSDLPNRDLVQCVCV